MRPCSRPAPWSCPRRPLVWCVRERSDRLMRVFMLGWEFPPFISGGLGTACYGLTKAMSALGTDVMFVLPRPVSSPFSTHVRLVSPRAGSSLASPSTEFRLDEFEHVTFRTIDAQMVDPYQRPEEFEKSRQERTGTVASEVEGLTPEGTAKAAGTAVARPAVTMGDKPGAHYAGDLFA